MWQYVPFGWAHSELKLEKRIGSVFHQCQKYHIIFYKSVFSSITDPGSPSLPIPGVPTFWEWFKMMMYFIYWHWVLLFFSLSLSFDWLCLPCLEDMTIFSPWKRKRSFPSIIVCVWVCVRNKEVGPTCSLQSINPKLWFSTQSYFAPISPGDIS